jgi:chemotaxis response regulator CheB
MPKHAIHLGAARHVLPPAEIAAALVEAVTRPSKGA